ncbi:MAG TPA: serine/threonine protein kinase [Burkholderiales bacterium]|nr:serine/threonine protein kinase [Burkholderiales bacterium]
MAHPYAGLTPEAVLDACADAGLRPDGRLLALNSYENRVYQVYLDEGAPVVVKFYRPGRWTREQILEEHAFALELAGREIPVVAPLLFDNDTLLDSGEFHFAVYPRRGGRTPNLEKPEVLEWIGRFIGRIHLVGAAEPFRFRETLDLNSFGTEPRAWLLQHAAIPADLLPSWKAVTEQALQLVAACYERAGDVRLIRLHGDCHPGNILWTDYGEQQGPHFVDLDDARMGPAIQDLWMLLSGDRPAMTRALSDVLAGYEEFMTFDRRELHLVEALRTLRLIHYSAWIARRWDDPAFPAAFPWFGTARYWQDRILELKEQIALMGEPPLSV